jgi:hypothetical protein
MQLTNKLKEQLKILEKNGVCGATASNALGRTTGGPSSSMMKNSTTGFA